MNLNKTVIIVSSRNKTYPTDTNGNFTISFNNAQLESFKAFRVKTVTVPYKMYPVNNTNNIIYFQESTGPLVAAQISPGYYTITTILAQINSVMNSASPNSQTYTATYDNTLDRITITSSGTFSLQFSNTVNSASSVLGFSHTNTSLNLSNIGNNGPILSIDCLYLRSSYISSQLLKGNILNNSITNIIQTIPINVSFNELIIYTAQDDSLQQLTMSNKFLNQIDFQITDFNGNIYDLNGSHVNIELEFYY